MSKFPNKEVALLIATFTLSAFLGGVGVTVGMVGCRRAVESKDVTVDVPSLPSDVTLATEASATTPTD